ncbi:DUF4369 domain-containing protein [Prevotella sp. MA2016]|uniref:DUF4369 domain-containing protein n=1 Tax=Prevotella sp. MA2016 TaxID=1408310 RepID=UPI00048D17A8|nr:DUF4369 domain-containing protein [Prevotella sp. MA2016]
MNNKNLFRLVVAGLVLCSCQSDVYQINGCAPQLHNGDTITLAFEDPPQKVLGQAYVEDGVFKFAGTTDTTLFCRAYLNSDRLTSISFFLEPGNITIELNRHPKPSRVSGTVLNNEWQALNDTVQKLGTQLIRLAQVSTLQHPPLPRQQLQQRIDSMHRRLSDCIIETGQRNRDNVLGKYIQENYKKPEFK